MKASGMYLSRSLSFADTEFEPLEVVLTPEQTHMYTAATVAWDALRMALDAALVCLPSTAARELAPPRPGLG